MSFADRTPTSPNEALLRTIADGSENPFADRDPQSANEYLLKKIAGEQVDEESPFNRDPQSANEYWLKQIAENGGGGGATVEELSVTDNGTYTAPQGKAYSPVNVSVPASAVVSGTKSITTNGTTDVTNYANANVAVPASAVVSGTKSITANGTGIDVTDYAAVDVAVPTGTTPTGTVSITANGTVDVTDYASADVAVPNTAETTSLSIENRSGVPITGYYHTVEGTPSKIVLKNFALGSSAGSTQYGGRVIKRAVAALTPSPFPVVAFYNSNTNNVAGLGTPTVKIGGVDTTDFWLGEMTYRNEYGTTTTKAMVVGAKQDDGAIKIIINAE